MTIRKSKNSPQTERKVSANHTSNKEFIYRIYREISTVRKHPEKYTEDLNRHFTKGGMCSK